MAAWLPLTLFSWIRNNEPVFPEAFWLQIDSIFCNSEIIGGGAHDCCVGEDSLVGNGCHVTWVILGKTMGVIFSWS